MKNNHCIILEIFIHASPRYLGSSDTFLFFHMLTMSSNFELLNPDDLLHVSETLDIRTSNVLYNVIPRPHILSYKNTFQSFKPKYTQNFDIFRALYLLGNIFTFACYFLYL